MIGDRDGAGTDAGAVADRRERVVRTLCGSRWLKVARFALARASEAIGEPMRFMVHLDGPLVDTQRAMLGEGMGERGRFVEADEADERVHPLLRGHPATLAWRRRDPLARKLLDVVLLADEPEVVFMDTDVLWLRRCGGWLREPLPGGVEGCFTAQVPGEEGLACSAWSVATGRLALARGINTGVFKVRKELLDLDRVEAVLRALPERAVGDPRRFWVEQTVWAALALARPTLRWGFAALTIPRSDRELHVPVEGVSAIHCVGPVRLGFWNWKHRPLGDERPPATMPTERLGALHAATGLLRVRTPANQVGAESIE